MCSHLLRCHRNPVIQTVRQELRVTICTPQSPVTHPSWPLRLCIGGCLHLEGLALPESAQRPSKSKSDVTASGRPLPTARAPTTSPAPMHSTAMALVPRWDNCLFTIDSHCPPVREPGEARELPYSMSPAPTNNLAQTHSSEPEVSDILH